jgi:hypothetical protein
MRTLEYFLKHITGGTVLKSNAKFVKSVKIETLN